MTRTSAITQRLIVTSTNSLTNSSPTLNNKLTQRCLSSARKPYVRPPTYKEQVKQGVPFGKRVFYGTENQFIMQAVFGLTLFISFVATPFLGKKLAFDDEFRHKYIPSWFDYRVEVPPNAMSREEMHEQLVAMQRDLHERAIKGEFEPEKLKILDGEREELIRRRNLEDPNGFGRLHPGLPDVYDETDE